MTDKKNETQATGLQLTRETGKEMVKTYFDKVFELKQSGKEFPVNLDEVWPLVYGRRDVAVKTLKSDFIEGVDFQSLRQKVEQKKEQENRGGHNKVDYFLSTDCLEYFIAKKVKSVFEVYRIVFHKTIEQGAKQLQQDASGYTEGDIVAVKMGNMLNHVLLKKGVIYAKFGPIMRHIGYQSAVGKPYVDRLGSENFIKVDMGNGQQHYFMNIIAFTSLVQMTTIKPNPKIIQDVYRLFKADPDQPLALPEQTYYMYTDEQMDEIMNNLAAKRSNRLEIMRMLLAGKNRR